MSPFFNFLKKIPAPLIVLISSLSLGFLGYYLYKTSTKIVPVSGGVYIEGTIGEVKYLNPLLSSSQADSDLVSLIFSGLLKRTPEEKIVPDLAESFQISKDYKTFTFILRDNLFWQDGEKLTADDALFTFKLVQHPDYEGRLAETFKDLKIKKINNKKISFSLPNSDREFLGNFTLGILPSHLLSKTEVSELLSSSFNLNPIGSGPYRFENIDFSPYGEIQAISLVVNPLFYAPRPYLEKIIFKFYPDWGELLRAYAKREILGFFPVSPLEVEEIKGWGRLTIYKTDLPQYTALYLNQKKSPSLKIKEVRLALSYATNRETIVQEVLKGYGQTQLSPLFPEMVGGLPGQVGRLSFSQPDFNPREAQKLLEKAGFVEKDKDGIRKKDKEKLQFKLLTQDNPTFIKTAEKIKEMWTHLGIGVELNIQDSEVLSSEIIPRRDYEILLFGQNLGYNLDLLSFWHSSQAFGGLNLSDFTDPKVDRILEESHNLTNQKLKAAAYNKFSKIITRLVPAIFLYRPHFLYAVDRRIRGVEIKKIVLPPDRFGGIENWYINYKRVLK